MYPEPNCASLCYASPTPATEWTRLGERLPARTNIKNYGKLLIISKVTEEETGKYMCKAKNPLGETVHYFHVEVEGLQSFNSI